VQEHLWKPRPWRNHLAHALCRPEGKRLLQCKILLTFLARGWKPKVHSWYQRVLSTIGWRFFTGPGPVLWETILVFFKWFLQAHVPFQNRWGNESILSIVLKKYGREGDSNPGPFHAMELP
jgi:hypothetical protein